MGNFIKKRLNLKHLWQLPSGVQCCRDETILTVEAEVNYETSAHVYQTTSHIWEESPPWENAILLLKYSSEICKLIWISHVRDTHNLII